MGKQKKAVFLALFAATCLLLGGCGRQTVPPQGEPKVNTETNTEQVNEKHARACLGEMELRYATQFSVKYYEDGYASLSVADGRRYVLVPEGGEEDPLEEENPTFLHQPLDRIYLAASSAMDLFRELEGLSALQACSTREEDYCMEPVRERIRRGDILYVGKYSAPDYETLLQRGTDLAVESTMIYHSPKVKEELEALGIPVFIERSSYEKEPLGRLEWIKLYGLLLGKEEAAGAFFEEQANRVEAIRNEAGDAGGEAPKAVFFYISGNGYVNVRKPGDYVSKMIERAGGKYALESLQTEEENALSTVNISWEDFYLYAKEADLLIYNGTIDGGVPSVEALVRENALFEEFKALQEGQVYCAMNNMYQETSRMGDIILEMAEVITRCREKDTSPFQGTYLNYLQ